jgi:hypothetical protein
MDLLLTGWRPCGNGASIEFPTQMELKVGEARMGHEADLSELRDALLRPAAQARDLPEMQHAV